MVGKRLAVLAAPGDRRDEDIREIARIAAGSFDRFICRRDDNPRGRGDDEVPEMLRAELLEAGVDASRIEVIPDEARALDRALEIAGGGDLLLVLGDNVKRCWKQIIYFNSESRATEPATKTPTFAALPEIEPFTFGDDVEIISDERGVRIAREEAD